LYEFSENHAEIDVDEMVAMMEEILQATLEIKGGQNKNKS